MTMDDQRVIALLTSAYGQPSEAYVLEKISRSVELWNQGEKALAQIHLSYAALPACGDDEAFGLFLAEECLAAGLMPAELMKALGFGSALEKHSPARPRARSILDRDTLAVAGTMSQGL